MEDNTRKAKNKVITVEVVEKQEQKATDLSFVSGPGSDTPWWA